MGDGHAVSQEGMGDATGEMDDVWYVSVDIPASHSEPVSASTARLLGDEQGVCDQ